jgi:hypothetical protein
VTVERVRFTLLSDCMRTFGIELQPPSVPPVWNPHKNAAYIGWLDTVQVERAGYRGADRGQEGAGFTGFSVSDEQWAVVEGKRRSFHGKPVPAGGCAGRTAALLNEGSLKLLGGKAARMREEEGLGLLLDDASARASADERIRAAEQAWSECMTEKGFHYPDTGAAMGDPRWAVTAANDHAPPPQGTDAEIGTAVADAGCRRDTNYYGVRQAVYRDHQQKIIAGNREKLNRIKIIDRTQLTNARKYIAAGLKPAW